MQVKKKTIRKPISYCYNPYFEEDRRLAFVEVWQILEDEVLGKLFPWQYRAGAEFSKRIETLNFLAVGHFSQTCAQYTQTPFIFKISARMLDEGNVQRLGAMLKPNLLLCFDIYSLERLGEKDSLMGLKYLIKRGAVIMIEGVERAPIEVLTKYPADYFLLDYRYYNETNRGLLTMVKQLADSKGIRCIVSSVNSAHLRSLFVDNGITVMAGSAFVKPRRRLEGLLNEFQKKAVESSADDGLIKSKPDEMLGNVPEIDDQSEKEEKGGAADSD